MTPPVSVGYREVRLEDGPLRYELRRSSRRTVGITVQLDGSVVVTAPLRASLEGIHEALQRHRRWIRGQVRKAGTLPPPPRPPEWRSGDRLRFLGEWYLLEVGAGRPRSVEIFDGKILARVPDPARSGRVRELLEGWYRARARETFGERMEELIRETPQLRLARPPALRVRRLKRRWGSCSPKGEILMNTQAVKLPSPLVDYILMHELCHLRAPHHRPSYWRLLGRCMPDWEERKRLLDREMP